MSIDTTTRYLGLKLANPLMVAACPLTKEVESLCRLEEAGAGGAVLHSLFEEQIEHDSLEVHHLREDYSESFAESLSYFPELDDYSTGPENYLKLIEDTKKAVSMPIIASLNGATEGGWVNYAQRIQDAGADALELNVYFVATDPSETSEQVESRYLRLVEKVRQAISIPLAVKICFYFSSLPNMARRLVEAGADGLVLFNRFLYPEMDLETLEVHPHLHLSTPRELGRPLRWIAILRGQIKASLAATSGVHSSEDALKAIMAGADVVMIATALLRHGPDHLPALLTGMCQWLRENEYASVDQMRGSMTRENCPDPEAFERANYLKALVSYTNSRYR